MQCWRTERQLLSRFLLAGVLISAFPASSAEDIVLPKPLTAEFLAAIDEIPFGKLGAAASPEYWAIVRQGQGIIPELIELLDDPTFTQQRVPLFGGHYAVGDVAMSAISNIVRGVPWLEFITRPDDPRIEAIGFGVYWKYVRESPANRSDGVAPAFR